jgi:DNA-binding transcriptional regulator/RsmH inhibitor MraZ
MDKVELWDAESFKAQTALQSDDLSDLANEVLGNDFLNAHDGI